MLSNEFVLSSSQPSETEDNIDSKDDEARQPQATMKPCPDSRPRTRSMPDLSQTQTPDEEPRSHPSTPLRKQPTGDEEPRSRTSTPLRHRRGVKIDLSELRSDSEDGMKFLKGDSLPRQMKSPAILGRTFEGRPLPGAFPTRRTLIIFDWDDTLCPTSWLRSLIKERTADLVQWKHQEDFYHEIPEWFKHPLPDLPDVRDLMKDLQRAVIDVINTAQAYGVVCIVTNAVEGWVEKTTKKWLPLLQQYILGHGSRPPIQVLYGQQEYCHPQGGAAELGWVDGLGPLTWWKKAAMSSAITRIEDLYRLTPGGTPRSQGCASAGISCLESADPKFAWQLSSESKGLTNIISIGDSEAEMQAAELACVTQLDDQNCRRFGCAKRSSSAPPGPRSHGRPWVKTLKLLQQPSAEQIIEQLDTLTKSLPQVIASRQHMRKCADDLTDWGSPNSRCMEKDPEAQVQRFLRIQTI